MIQCVENRQKGPTSLEEGLHAKDGYKVLHISYRLKYSNGNNDISNPSFLAFHMTKVSQPCRHPWFFLLFSHHTLHSLSQPPRKILHNQIFSSDPTHLQTEMTSD